MEGIQQLALVSSILGGFSITYVCTILTMKTERRIEFWIFILGLIASMSFLVTTLGWSLLGTEEIASELSKAEQLASAQAHNQFLVKFFLLGLFTILSSISLSGWLKSKRTGIVTTIIGVLTLFILFTQIVGRYIEF